MQLTRFTDYTLRVLIAVGISKNRGITIAEISAQYGISKNHLMKVVQHLGRTGYLATVRGKGGGVRLARPAEKINLGAVVREAEGGFNVVPCFDAARPGQCVIAPSCVLKRVLHRALRAFLEVLDDCTLAELIGPDKQLRTLLGRTGVVSDARARNRAAV